MIDTVNETAWRAEFEKLGEEQVRKLLDETIPDAHRRFIYKWLGEQASARLKMGTEHQHNERTIANWTRVLGAFTIILTGTSILTALILYWTDQTSRLRDRAFLYFGDPPVTPYPPSKPVTWGVGISVTNAGNMPARRATVRYACPDASSRESVQDPFSLAKWADAKIGSVLGPKQSVVLQGCNVPMEVINDAKKICALFFMLSKHATSMVSTSTKLA